MRVLLSLTVCLLSASANANAHAPGDRVSMGVACGTADDALEVGVSIDRKLESATDVIHDKIVDGTCFVLMGALRRDDATLVSVIESAENTDVWEVRTDVGRTLFVPYDRGPGL